MKKPALWFITAVVYTVTPLRAFAALPACPSVGATLTITVDNETGSPQPVTLAGALVTASCSGGSTSFTQTVQCPAGSSDCLTVAGLASGVWKHQISVGQQNQYKKSVVVAADPQAVPNTISWVAFKTVLTVDRTDDISSNPTPQCPSNPGTRTCTLRQAIAAGATALGPLLVQFDPTVFVAGIVTKVRLSQPNDLSIDGYRMVVDGTDSRGNPSFRGDPYSRVVQLPSSGGNFVFTNGGAALTGLFIQRPALSAGARPRDMIVFDGTGGLTQQNSVVNCKIDGGGSALATKLTAQDCIQGLNGAGADWVGANVVQNTEVTACPDKGVKATTLAYVKVQDSWLHHNIGGGIQATLSGGIEADRNLVEYSGYNAARQVFAAANGLSANGASAATPDIPSVLQTDGNTIRNNSSRGISVQETSSATISNDLTCGAANSGDGGQNGIAIFNLAASAAAATVRGVAAVYNGRNGATIADQSTGDFGQANADGGNNAFTQNATNRFLGGHNFDNSSTQANVPAIANQWQHCYADPAHPAATCDGNIDLDVSGSVTFTPPQPYRADASTIPVQISAFYPTKAKAGDLVRISGNGFNAVDAYPHGGNCTTTVQQYNSCGNPIVGNCVQYQSAPGVWTKLQVQSVTPTEIVVKLPSTFTCSQAVAVRVRRRDSAGAAVTATGTFCTNS
ncbi:MAG: right-handed parallel beta-helix repeat-containing protein [Candidatus Binatia bacterium]